MIRFAVAVTGLEIALTFLASLWVALVEAPEPYLSRGELRSLGFDAESHTTERKVRFGAVFSYDTRFTVSGRSWTVYVSLRVETPPEEYSVRREGEMRLSLDSARGVTTVIDADHEGERGFSVRHRGPKEIRAELVRLRGSDMMIVRVTRPDLPGAPGNAEAAACERAVRVIDHYMLRKQGWR